MRKSWKKQWINELDERVPALCDDVLNAPISIADTPEMQKVESRIKTENDGGKAEKTCAKKGWSFTDKLNLWVEKLTANIKSRKRLLLRVTAITAATILLCVVGLTALFPAPIENSVGAFALEINPRAVFTVDEKGVVTSVIAGNTDADVILSSEQRKKELENKPIEKALETFVDYAVRLGYVELETGDIIRLSVCEEDRDISAVQGVLTNYFRKKGLYVAVLAEEVSAKVFGERMIGVSNTTLEKTLQAFRDLPKLYTEREVLGKTVAELQAIYQARVHKENLKTAVEDFLKGALEWMNEKSEDLQTIAEVNNQIKKHSDNPAFLFKDYWSVKKYQKAEDLSDDFAFMMQEMTALLGEYEQTYEEKIETELALNALLLEASSEYLVEIAKLLADFSMDVFNSSMELLTAVLAWFGVEVDLVKLCRTPQSTEEYLEQTKQYHQICYTSLREEGRDAYKTQRAALTEEAYAEFLQAVCDKYGSLEGYWAAVCVKE